jgi:hypothetical protein
MDLPLIRRAGHVGHAMLREGLETGGFVRFFDGQVKNCEAYRARIADTGFPVRRNE